MPFRVESERLGLGWEKLERLFLLVWRSEVCRWVLLSWEVKLVSPPVGVEVFRDSPAGAQAYRITVSDSQGAPKARSEHIPETGRTPQRNAKLW